MKKIENMCRYERRDLASGILREVTFCSGDKDVGRFGMYEHKLWDMTIYVEPEFRGRGVTRILIRAMIDALKHENVYDGARFVYIDTDASENFWDHVGLSVNPHLDDSSVPEYGYEKRITLDELLSF